MTTGHAREFAREMLEMMAGPLVWLLYLLAMYGAAALHCARAPGRAPSDTAFGAASIALTVLAIGAVVASLVHARRELASRDTSDARRFADRVGIVLGVFGLVAIVWTALPPLLSPTCNAAALQRSW